MEETPISACESKRRKKPLAFSRSEIEAAKQLIQLSSSGDYSEQGGEGHRSSSSNNSCSYSVVQGNPPDQEHSISIKADAAAADVSSVAATVAEEDALADDESFPIRRNNHCKRYRFIEDLYNATVPVTAVKAKKKIKSRK